MTLIPLVFEIDKTKICIKAQLKIMDFRAQQVDISAYNCRKDPVWTEPPLPFLKPTFEEK